MSNSILHNEAELLQQIAAGDEHAFKQLVDAYWRNLYGHALAYSKSAHLAEEVTQDAFIAIWMNREKLPDVSNFSGYLFIIVRNKLLNAIRQKLAAPDNIENIPLEEAVWRPDRQLEYRQAYTELLKGIEELPPARKKVFMMSRMEGKSHEEIARELGISRNTVKEHIVKALNCLRNYVNRHHDRLFWLLYWFFCLHEIFFYFPTTLL